MKQFDVISRAYPTEKTNFRSNRILYSRWLRECGDVKGRKILDAGCGNGFGSRLLAQRGAIVHGFDSSREMIKLAAGEERKRPLGITYFVGDASEIDRVDKFDFVTATFVILHARTENKLQQFMLSFSKNLKRGGKLVALEQNPDNPTVKHRRGCFVSREWIDKPFNEGSRIRVFFHDQNGSRIGSVINHYYSKHALEKALKNAGFSNISWIDFSDIRPSNGDLETSVILKATRE